MSKYAAILGLAAIASAGAPAYGESAPAYGASSSWDPVSSSAPAYAPSSSSDPYSSSAPGYGSSSWYPSSSSYVWPVSSSVIPSSTSPPSSVPTADCWSKCFAENDITSESELCGNTDVDQCIQDTCSCEEDKAYWAWYESYCTTTPSSSVSSGPTTTAPVVPASSTADCWGKCFAEAGIASESELCGNTAVDECIHDTCSCEEDKAYWQWYNSYCPVTTTASITIPPPTSTTPAGPGETGNCWTACFAEFDVTSENALCGNDEVSKCIHDTCSASLDKAYWDWYNGFCTPATTSVVTVVTTVPGGVPSGYPGGYSTPAVYTTTYVSTITVPATPVESSPVTTLPSPPASAPYGYGTGSWGAVPATGTGASYPSASAWAPVPATGAGSIVQPGFLFAAAMAVAALF